jgi:uncharacterized GH25 family protein
MKRFSTRLAAVLLIAGSIAAVTTTAAQAHGIWFAQRARQVALIYGVGADDLDAVSRLDKLTSVTGYDENWQPVPTTLRVAGAIPVVDSEGPVAAVAAAMNYGVWTKTPDGVWHNAGLDEFPDAVVSERTMKYAVHLTQMPTSPVPLMEGHTLQLVPVSPAIPQLAGQPIVVRAFYEGQPLAGARIQSDYVNDPDQAPVLTDAYGYAVIPVRNQGLNVLIAVYVGPSDEPARYAHVEHRATLSFVLPHLPE